MEFLNLKIFKTKEKWTRVKARLEFWEFSEMDIQSSVDEHLMQNREGALKRKVKIQIWYELWEKAKIEEN